MEAKNGGANIPFKICLLTNDSENYEMRRLSVNNFSSANFVYVTEKIIEIFSPKLDKKQYTLYWIDKDNDKIVISSVEEFAIAVEEMMKDFNIVKLFVKVITSDSPKKENDNEMLHPFVSCDGCGGNVVGFRYKCIVCDNFDLCADCEQQSIHPEHPMLRIPNPYIFEQTDLPKLVYFLSLFLFSKTEGGKRHPYHRRKYSHDVGSKDFCKKKRKYEKYESKAEPEEMDDFVKSSGKKKSHCVYTQLCHDFLNNFDPKLQADNAKKTESRKKAEEETKEDLPHITFFKSVGKMLNALYDPLGIDVDVEVRTKGSEKKETKTAEKNEETPTTSTAAEKESHTPAPEEKKDTVNEKVEEISKTLANQKLSDSSEKGDWVYFEELSRGSLEKEMAEAPKSESLNENRAKNSTPKETTDLYPKLNEEPKHKNPAIQHALDLMLSMGFTNEGGWLTSLLEAKNGDIHQVLEALSPVSKT